MDGNDHHKWLTVREGQAEKGDVSRNAFPTANNAAHGGLYETWNATRSEIATSSNAGHGLERDAFQLRIHE